jgi:hypothetical protein
MSDQIENRVIEAKSRGIYEAPGMALLHIGYERLLSAIHNESTLDLYATLGRRLGRLLYEGKWYDPEANLLKDALTRWIAPSVTGEVTVELRRGEDYTLLDDAGGVHGLRAREALHGARRGASAFTPEDRIGALETAEPLGDRQPRDAHPPPAQRRGAPRSRRDLRRHEAVARRDLSRGARPVACSAGRSDAQIARNLRTPHARPRTFDFPHVSAATVDDVRVGKVRPNWQR